MNTKYQGIVKGYQIDNPPNHYIHPTDPTLDAYDPSEIPNWPAPGDKIKFIRKTPHWFKNVMENADKLTIGEIYTVRFVEVYSSWCLVKVEELPETEAHGADWLGLGFFEWPIERG